MTRAQLMVPYRFVFAALALIAVGTQFAVHLENHFDVVNFFSYFTNLGNLFAVVVFVVGGVRTLRRRPGSRAWDTVRLISVVDMIFVGLVFNLLLTEVAGGVLPWVNVVVHMVMPVAVLVDWIVLPVGRRLPWSAAAVGLVVPVVYSVYTLVRGAITAFYPYPFFDPEALGGYGPVAVYMVVLLVALVVLSIALVGLARLAGRFWKQRPSPRARARRPR
ncbi:Pr6Pr family membrane protein [Frigoribacterium sp. VKM Ac-2836]|uniref:Pr6Pr family membrane protein n=1 Tax=Frigoribacterium sp. VKM Ac-2836 TaxID=2739014 RepID=UPI0015652ADD|nr:Pr6Pr family membrane protein [Frigoribacterium sp. VKM Ac-2836]NRD26945.1 Pr6Pr family membrane protein [Frigoribacterium sp. VKM Ac-2836]